MITRFSAVSAFLMTVVAAGGVSLRKKKERRAIATLGLAVDFES